MSIEDAEKTIRAHFLIRNRPGLPYSIKRGSRNNLAVVFQELGYRKGAEIGVARGEFSELLCRINPNLHLICIDPWETIPNLEEGAYKRKLVREYAETTARLANYNCDIRKLTSQAAVVDIPDGSLDFVFIDGAHTFDDTMFDLLTWTKKVRPGGIVAGHDICMAWRGVIIAVEAYVRAHDIHSWYCTDEQVPTYFWVQRPEYLLPS